jgi:hypothetical protein
MTFDRSGEMNFLLKTSKCISAGSPTMIFDILPVPPIGKDLIVFVRSELLEFLVINCPQSSDSISEETFKARIVVRINKPDFIGLSKLIGR